MTLEKRPSADPSYTTLLNALSKQRAPSSYVQLTTMNKGVRPRRPNYLINLNPLWPNVTSLFFLSFILQYKLCVNVIYSVKKRIELTYFLKKLCWCVGGKVKRKNFVKWPP